MHMCTYKIPSSSLNHKFLSISHICNTQHAHPPHPHRASRAPRNHRIPHRQHHPPPIPPHKTYPLPSRSQHHICRNLTTRLVLCASLHLPEKHHSRIHIHCKRLHQPQSSCPKRVRQRVEHFVADMGQPEYYTAEDQVRRGTELVELSDGQFWGGGG
jgi:hypothetical protein